MSVSRKTLVALAGAAGLALPLVTLAPAHAATLSNGCNVDPSAPVFDHLNNTGDKVIKYEVYVSCDANRSIEIEDQRWEWDYTSADDPLGTTTYNMTFSDPPGPARLKSVTKNLPDADAWGDNNEEIYHSVRFRVTGTLDGVTSPWTAWEDSPIVTFHLY